MQIYHKQKRLYMYILQVVHNIIPHPGRTIKNDNSRIVSYTSKNKEPGDREKKGLFQRLAKPVGTYVQSEILETGNDLIRVIYINICICKCH